MLSFSEKIKLLMSGLKFGKKCCKLTIDNNILPAQYGEYVKENVNGKTVYFLVFTIEINLISRQAFIYKLSKVFLIG